MSPPWPKNVHLYLKRMRLLIQNDEYRGSTVEQSDMPFRYRYYNSHF